MLVSFSVCCRHFPDEEGTETAAPAMDSEAVCGCRHFPDEEGTKVLHRRCGEIGIGRVRGISPTKRARGGQGLGVGCWGLGKARKSQ